MTFTISRCTGEQLPAVVACLDREFVFAKGREISLPARFPRLFLDENLPNIYISRIADSFAACVAIKRFEWLTSGRLWQAAMLGLVYTRPETRGHGLGTRLLEAVQKSLQEDGADFGVLWTRLGGYYRRLGWRAKDSGVFGEVLSPDRSSKAATLAPQTMDAALSAGCEAIRAKWLPDRIFRTPLDYQTIPLPVTSLDVYLQDDSDPWQAYALVGRNQASGYLYEMVGNPKAYGILWANLSAHYQKIYINDVQESSSKTWLDAHANVSWKEQNQAMWLPWSEAARQQSFEGWYVPYLDRI